MARGFDGRPEWRARFHLDEGATNRLGKAIIRLGASLPLFVMYALGPREGGAALWALAGLGLAAAGTWALVSLRSWGLFALGGAALALIVAGPQTAIFPAPLSAILAGPTAAPQALGFADALPLGAAGAAAVALILLALAPFARPALRFLRARD
jgi:hypothetical protein